MDEEVKNMLDAIRSAESEQQLTEEEIKAFSENAEKPISKFPPKKLPKKINKN